jgi:hypothetical protein
MQPKAKHAEYLSMVRWAIANNAPTLASEYAVLIVRYSRRNYR